MTIVDKEAAVLKVANLVSHDTAAVVTAVAAVASGSGEMKRSNEVATTVGTREKWNTTIAMVVVVAVRKRIAVEVDMIAATKLKVMKTIRSVDTAEVVTGIIATTGTAVTTSVTKQGISKGAVQTMNTIHAKEGSIWMKTMIVRTANIPAGEGEIATNLNVITHPLGDTSIPESTGMIVEVEKKGRAI